MLWRLLRQCSNCKKEDGKRPKTPRAQQTNESASFCESAQKFHSATFSGSFHKCAEQLYDNRHSHCCSQSGEFSAAAKCKSAAAAVDDFLLGFHRRRHRVARFELMNNCNDCAQDAAKPAEAAAVAVAAVVAAVVAVAVVVVAEKST